MARLGDTILLSWLDCDDVVHLFLVLLCICRASSRKTWRGSVNLQLTEMIWHDQLLYDELSFVNSISVFVINMYMAWYLAGAWSRDASKKLAGYCVAHC